MVILWAVGLFNREERKKAEMERIAAEAEKQEEFIPPVADDSLPFGDEPTEEKSESCENFIPDFTEPEKTWVALKVNLSKDDETEMLRFLEARRIEFVVL
jgi:hypothetical protein